MSEKENKSHEVSISQISIRDSSNKPPKKVKPNESLAPLGGMISVSSLSTLSKKLSKKIKPDKGLAQLFDSEKSQIEKKCKPNPYLLLLPNNIRKRPKNVSRPNLYDNFPSSYSKMTQHCLYRVVEPIKIKPKSTQNNTPNAQDLKADTETGGYYSTTPSRQNFDLVRKSNFDLLKAAKTLLSRYANQVYLPTFYSIRRDHKKAVRQALYEYQESYAKSEIKNSLQKNMENLLEILKKQLISFSQKLNENGSLAKRLKFIYLDNEEYITAYLCSINTEIDNNRSCDRRIPIWGTLARQRR